MTDHVSEDELKLRRDMRLIPTFTIDPYDAKDFDDAISFRELSDGIFEIGIHIADVSHYVTQDSETDIEAQKRATSVYMVDRVIPMLPERLSNELCSLRPNEDKRCFSVIVQMNDKGKVLEQWFGKTLIHSIQRFAYEEAQEVLEGKPHALSHALLTLNKLAYKLRERRYKKGAINFETVEVKFKLDENNKPIGVYVKERKDAHMLIEDFMLLANRLVAEFVSRKKLDGAPVPFVYRIHDLPDMTRLEDLRDTAAVFGYKLNFDTPRQIAESFNKMMKELKGKPEQNMLESLAIRTMSKAIYSTDNIGHYGLAFKHYSHFTSPIRRYPDVLAHRILNDILYGNKQRKYPHLEDLCKHASDMEKSAADAERMSVKYKQVEYMQTRVGQVFDALITGVTEWGVFAEVIENKCEGLIKLTMLGDERFELDIKAHAVVGIETGTTYSLGDKIKVRVLKANLEKRQLDYELVYDKDDED
jgi:ribonuclease R